MGCEVGPSWRDAFGTKYEQLQERTKESEISGWMANTLLLARRLVLSSVPTGLGYFVQGALGTSEE